MSSLTPNLAEPKEILSLGTFDMQPGGCDHGPLRATREMKSVDVLLSIQERVHSRSPFPPRPDHFRFEQRFQECFGAPGIRTTSIDFHDAGRDFTALVALGARVSAQDAMGVLDGFSPWGESDPSVGHTPADTEVPSEADQLFLASRVCKGVLHVKHRPPISLAVNRGLSRRLLRRAMADLEAPGNALGKFPAPDVRSLAGGSLKVATSIASLLGIRQGETDLGRSVEELRYVADGLSLPECAIESAGASQSARPISLGGRTLEMLAARGSIWVLTCDSGCAAKARASRGRVVRIDPSRRQVIASVRIRGASGLAVGAGGVYVTDFWRNTVRRFDPATLRVSAKLGLALPFELVPGDDAFLPYDTAATGNAVWVSTARGVLARVDPRARHIAATVRLPFDATGEVAPEEGAVWVAEQLAGVYRVDPAKNRVVAKIRVGPRGRRLAISDVVLGPGEVFAVGARTRNGALATGNAVARIDPGSNRVEAVTGLPAGAIAVAYGDGALWVAELEKASIQRIDPRTGEVTDEIEADAGAALVIAGGHLWAASREGTIRRLPLR